MIKPSTIAAIVTLLSITLNMASNSHGYDSERKEILRAVAGICTPDLCKPKILKIVKGYATVDLLCKRTGCDNATAYLKKTVNGWVVVDHGTGIEDEDLIEYGFPKNVVKKLHSDGH